MSTVAGRITRRYAWYALVALIDGPSRALSRRRTSAPAGRAATTTRPRRAPRTR